jgi:hypothetical protein
MGLVAAVAAESELKTTIVLLSATHEGAMCRKFS